MGQRHQLFLIAKVNNRYRTLAALHQQWSYEALAIKRCGSVLKVLKANGSALRRDVRKAERLDWVEVEAKSLDVSAKAGDCCFVWLCDSFLRIEAYDVGES